MKHETLETCIILQIGLRFNLVEDIAYATEYICQHCGNICRKVFENGLSKICERQPLKKLK